MTTKHPDGWSSKLGVIIAVAGSAVGLGNFLRFPGLVADKETGGGLSLPIWIDYMSQTLKGVPIDEPVAPGGLLNLGGEWYYQEFANNSGVSSLGLDDKLPVAPSDEERRSILDLFKR